MKLFSVILIFSTLFSIHAAAQGFQPMEEEQEEAPEVVLGEKEPKKEDAKEAVQKTDEKSFSAVVRAVRGGPPTEVFFVDQKESFVIPRNSDHNRMLEACLQSSRSKTPVQVTVHSKTRQILSLDGSTGSPSKTGQEGSK